MIRNDKQQERGLFRRLVDGTLSSAEFALIEERLLRDAGFRERYVRAIHIEGLLDEAFNFPGTFREKQRPSRNAGAWIAVALTSAALLIGLYVGRMPEPAPRPPIVDQAAPTAAEPAPVAIVTRREAIEETMPKDLQPGTRIRPGTLTLGRGQLQIEFLNGALLNLEGPAELHILSVEAATLVSGKAAVRIHPEARGFVLNAPEATIVDLGTEFAVSVGARGESEIQVMDGEVDVSLIGNDGNTLTSQRVAEAESLRVNRAPAALESIKLPSVKLPAIHEQTAPPLAVPEEYVHAIRAANPLIFWRFEQVVDGRVPNEVGPRWSAVPHADADDPRAIVIGDGNVRFTPSAFPHHLEPDEPISGFNAGAFTVEFWVTLDRLHRATLVAVVSEEQVPRNPHLSLIEMLNKSSLVHAPGSFRFLHRHPPGNNGGVNLFSNGDFTPGLWHHLAVVRTPSALKLFLNGQLVRRLEVATTSDDAPYRILLGQIYESGVRQLAGALDEFAIYLHPLTDDEIGAHYRAMRPTAAR